MGLGGQECDETISIVMTGAGADPVKEGLIESLARPGGNVTADYKRLEEN